MFKIISIPAGASPGLAPLVLLISSLQQSLSLLLPCCRTSMTISLLRIFSLRHNSCLSNKKRDILDNRGIDCWNWSSLCLVQNKTPNRQQSLSLISSLQQSPSLQCLEQSPSPLSLRLKLWAPSKLEVRLHWFFSIADFSSPMTVQRKLPPRERRK